MSLFYFSGISEHLSIFFLLFLSCLAKSFQNNETSYSNVAKKEGEHLSQTHFSRIFLFSFLRNDVVFCYYGNLPGRSAPVAYNDPTNTNHTEHAQNSHHNRTSHRDRRKATSACMMKIYQRCASSHSVMVMTVTFEKMVTSWFDAFL